MEISISTGMYYKKNYKEILDIIAATSCRNIELFLNQAFIDIPINQLKKEIDDRNLKVLSIHTPLEFIAFSRHESEDFWIEKCLNYSKIFDSKLIVSHMVLGKYFKTISETLDDIHKKNILKYTNRSEIYITTENLPCYADGSFLGNRKEFTKFISENNVPITFDTTHCGASKISIIEMFCQVKELVKNIHISDFKDGDEHKILSNGELPLKEFLSVLKLNNYKGIITIELDFDNKKRNDVKDSKEAIKELEKCIEYINNSINI